MIHVLGPSTNMTNHNMTYHDGQGYNCTVQTGNMTNTTTALRELSPFYDFLGGESHVIAFLFEVPQYYYFRFTYYMTLTSCVLGIVKFLDVGPTRILAVKGWSNYVGYVCAILSVFISLEKKALGLGSDGKILNTILMSVTNCTPDSELIAQGFISIYSYLSGFGFNHK